MKIEWLNYFVMEAAIKNVIPAGKETRGKMADDKYFFQPKLTINQPGDVYEQEADAMADKVMRMTDTSVHGNFFNPSPLYIQCKCQHCEEEEKKMQRKEATAGVTQASGQTENYIGSLNGGGRTLTKGEKDFFEPRFGYDFSNVRLHTDTAANQSAKEVNALAYTHSSNIVFGSNQYQPGTESGKRLMAHELTHVVQQQTNIVQPMLIQRDPPPGGDPTLPNPFYVQPGGPFDVGDNIFTFGYGPDGFRFGFPVPGASPGSDNGSITLFCNSGQRRVLHNGDCCDTASYNAATDTCCEDGKVPQGTACVDASTPGLIPPTVAPPTISPGLPGFNHCPPHSIPYMGGCLNLGASQQQQQGGTPPAPPQGLTGTFPVGTIDDFNIDESTLNSRQEAAYQRLLSTLRLTMHNCPGTVVTLTGYADAPGDAAHNIQLSQSRAESIGFRLLVDLINPGSALPTITTRGDGTNNPVDTTAGPGYSARNRRVEAETTVACPALSSTLTSPTFGGARH